jgi:hypothetical protein
VSTRDFCLRIYREAPDTGELTCLYSGVLGEGVPEDIWDVYHREAEAGNLPLTGSIEPKDTQPAQSLPELIARGRS